MRRDYDEAQDLAQEAFVRIFQELPKFDQTRKFFPWMYRVAHNSCVNSLRKLGKEKAMPDDFSEFEPSDPTQDPVSSYEKLEQSERIAKAIREMPEQYRLPVLLKYMEGLSYEEISDRLDLSVSTIESRLFRGRNYLRKILQIEKQKAT
jgi:RNA polymerase sigma-70 factor (ECF subfamily)